MNTVKRLLTRRASSVAKNFAICVGLLLLPPSARAVEPSRLDAVTDVLRAAQSATSAEVFLVPNTLSTVKQIDQDEVPKYGCRYQVSQDQMGELLDVVNRAEIEASDAGPRRPDLRILIRLYHKGGAVTALAFREGAFPNDSRVHGFVDGVRATAAAHFPETIRRWAAGNTPTAPNRNGVCP